jgi:hypothetical protein
LTALTEYQSTWPGDKVGSGSSYVAAFREARGCGVQAPPTAEHLRIR